MSWCTEHRTLRRVRPSRGVENVLQVPGSCPEMETVRLVARPAQHKSHHVFVVVPGWHGPLKVPTALTLWSRENLNVANSHFIALFEHGAEQTCQRGVLSPCKHVYASFPSLLAGRGSFLLRHPFHTHQDQRPTRPVERACLLYFRPLACVATCPPRNVSKSHTTALCTFPLLSLFCTCSPSLSLISTCFQNQINVYNEIANTNEALMEADSMGGQLGVWLVDNKIIEHIFGPNLHVEVCVCASVYMCVCICVCVCDGRAAWGVAR